MKDSIAYKIIYNTEQLSTGIITNIDILSFMGVKDTRGGKQKLPSSKYTR